MIPQLLIASDKRTINKYLNSLKEKDDLFFEILPSLKEYSIKDVRGVISETNIFYRERRIYFFYDFQNSSIPAQNALLKILEQPPHNVLFILSTGNPNSILPTIRSRTKIVNLQKPPDDEVPPSIKKSFLEFLSKKNLDILVNPEFNQLSKEKALSLLNQIVYFFRERLSSDKKSPLVIKEILRLKSLLESNNLNPQLTIDHLLIFIGKTYSMKLNS